MGTKLNKFKKLLGSFKGRFKKQPRSSPRNVQLDAAAGAWASFQQSSSEGVLQFTDVLVDGMFVNRLLELSRNETNSAVQTLVFYDCLFDLSDPRTIADFNDLLSVHSIRSVEFWDGEVPVEAKSLGALMNILAQSSAYSLRRLKIEASLIGVGRDLSHLLQSCSSLLHLELIGCTLDMEFVQELSKYGFHQQSSLERVILESCFLVTDEILIVLLRGLAKINCLHHVQLSGNKSLSCQSLPALTSFLRQHINASSLQITIHSNPNLFANCDKAQARNFFEACLQSNSHKDLFLCQTGMNNVATSCLFQVLERNQTVERVDIRHNSFDDEESSEEELRSSSNQITTSIPSTQSWVKSLPKLQGLKTLHLPSNLSTSNSFQEALGKNMSLTTCSYPTSCYHEVRTKADILARNKTLDLVRAILINQKLSLSMYPRILNKVDKQMDINGDRTALFELIKGRSSELGK